MLQVKWILFLLDRFDGAADQFGEFFLLILDLVLLGQNVPSGADQSVRLTRLVLVTDQAILHE